MASRWDPSTPEVRRDQSAAFDDIRARCPVAHSDLLHWSVFGHRDVSRVLHDPATFSSAVSATHASVPNGLEGAEHAEFRRIIDPYFAAPRMAAFEPQCRALAIAAVERLPPDQDVEVMAKFAPRYALEALSSFLDWPREFQQPLIEWIRRNQQARRVGDAAALQAVAAEFDGYVREVLALRRQGIVERADDVVTRLLTERVHGRAITDEELVSLLRVWTAGELATVAASVGILVGYLAAHASFQARLREHIAILPAAIDEILRIHPPLLTSRRKTLRETNIGGQAIPAGEILTLMWATANRDPAVFAEPAKMRLDRNPENNLLYGAGLHACPGAPLSRLTLRVLVEELLRQWRIQPARAIEPVNAFYPAAGFQILGARFVPEPADPGQGADEAAPAKSQS
jgi:cytochrome P450